MSDKIEAAEQDSFEVLWREFKNSGLPVKEFCKKYLETQGVENPDDVLRRIERQFEQTDKHYDGMLSVSPASKK